MKYAFLLAILLLAPLATIHAAEPIRLRLLSYNIHHGEGRDGRFDLPRLAGVMKTVQPDLVALQDGRLELAGVHRP